MQISRLLIQCHWSIRKWYFSLILRSSIFVSIPHPVAPPPSSNGWYSVLATGVIAIPPPGPETVHSVKVFNLVLQINKQTDDSTLLDIQTRLSDKKARNFRLFEWYSDKSLWSKIRKTTLPSNTENMSNVGSNEKHSSDINTTDVDFSFCRYWFTSTVWHWLWTAKCTPCKCSK